MAKEHDVENKSEELTDDEFTCIPVLISHGFNYLKIKS